jgi:hypothetical protein
MRELKDLIICTSYRQHPQRAFPAFIYLTTAQAKRAQSSSSTTKPHYEYEAHLIAYTVTALAEWKMLMENPSCCMSLVDAMVMSRRAFLLVLRLLVRSRARFRLAERLLLVGFWSVSDELVVIQDGDGWR